MRAWPTKAMDQDHNADCGQGPLASVVVRRTSLDPRRYTHSTMQRLVLGAVLALCLAEAAALAIGGRAALAVQRRPAAPARSLPSMKSQEDKEFEEWVRKKKLASGVDPDEDFSASRSFSETLLGAGGVIAIVVPTVLAIWACAQTRRPRPRVPPLLTPTAPFVPQVQRGLSDAAVMRARVERVRRSDACGEKRRLLCKVLVSMWSMVLQHGASAGAPSTAASGPFRAAPFWDPWRASVSYSPCPAPPACTCTHTHSRCGTCAVCVVAANAEWECGPPLYTQSTPRGRQPAQPLQAAHRPDRGLLSWSCVSPRGARSAVALGGASLGLGSRLSGSNEVVGSPIAIDIPVVPRARSIAAPPGAFVARAPHPEPRLTSPAPLPCAQTTHQNRQKNHGCRRVCS